MKRLKLEDLLRDSISKYASLSLSLSKCSSPFTIKMLLDNVRLTSKPCDFGTWYFTRKDGLELQSLKDVQAPYIKVFLLYKKLEELFHFKTSKMDNLKKINPFRKVHNDPIQDIVSELHTNCLLLVNALKLIESEYRDYKLSLSPLFQPNSTISKKIEANIALIKRDMVLADLSPNPMKKTSIKIDYAVKQEVPTLVSKEFGAPSSLSSTDNSHIVNEFKPENKTKEPIIKNMESFATINKNPSQGSADSSILKITNNTSGGIEYKLSSRKEQWDSLLAMKKIMDSLD